MELVRELLNGWKSIAAATLSTVIAVLEFLVGNPAAADGRALALVISMMVADYVLGTTAAIATKTWSFPRLRQGAGKLLLWGAMLVIARQLARPIGVLGADAVLKFASDYMLVYLVLVDLVSVLKHCMCLAVVSGVAMPWLDQLINVVQRWHPDLPMVQAPPPLREPPGAPDGRGYTPAHSGNADNVTFPFGGTSMERHANSAFDPLPTRPIVSLEIQRPFVPAPSTSAPTGTTRKENSP